MPDSAPLAISASPSSRASTCPVCGGSASGVFFETSGVPVHCNVLWPSAEAARRAPRGDIRLAICSGCGLVFNNAFDASLVTYDAAYENSLHGSPRFEAYADSLARDLSGRFHLRNRLVVEVGCGKGEFLRRLCRTAGAKGLGIDASYDPSVAAGETDDPVTFVREPFSSLPGDLKPALVFCRHVLEHLADPRPFVSELTAAARRSPDGRVFLEVPNVLWTLRDLGIWDVIYEHCSYFSMPSLTRLAEVSDLRVDRAYSTFGDQFLCLEATPVLSPPRGEFSEDLSHLAELSARYSREYQEKVTYWGDRLDTLKAEGRRIAVWGAGSKGITFVNAVPGGADVTCLVDLNPRKNGRYVPGTGQQVRLPEALRDIKPDVMIVMNPVYRTEIEQRARELGLSCAIEVA